LILVSQSLLEIVAMSNAPFNCHRLRSARRIATVSETKLVRIVAGDDDRRFVIESYRALVGHWETLCERLFVDFEECRSQVSNEEPKCTAARTRVERQ
jgi:hypothetical protein